MTRVELKSRAVGRGDAESCLVNVRGDVVEPLTTTSTVYAVDRVFAVQDGKTQHNMLRVVKNHWTSGPVSSVKTAHTLYHFIYEYFAYTDWRAVVDKSLVVRSDVQTPEQWAALEGFVSTHLDPLLTQLTGRSVQLNLRYLHNEAGEAVVRLSGVNNVGTFYLLIRHYLLLFNLLRYSAVGVSTLAQDVSRAFLALDDAGAPLDVLLLAVSQELGELLPELPLDVKTRLIQGQGA